MVPLLVLDHLEGLVGDDLGLLEELAVVGPGSAQLVLHPLLELLLALPIAAGELGVAGVLLDQFLHVLYYDDGGLQYEIRNILFYDPAKRNNQFNILNYVILSQVSRILIHFQVQRIVKNNP